MLHIEILCGTLLVVLWLKCGELTCLEEVMKKKVRRCWTINPQGKMVRCKFPDYDEMKREYIRELAALREKYRARLQNALGGLGFYDDQKVLEYCRENNLK